MKCYVQNPPVGDNARKGTVKNPSQAFNPQTQQWVKRDSETGKFVDVKLDGTPFKGVRKELLDATGHQRPALQQENTSTPSLPLTGISWCRVKKETVAISMRTPIRERPPSTAPRAS